MSFTPQDFVAMQLRESYPAGDWNAAGIDRSQELAAIMLRAGIRDIANLQLRAVTIYSSVPVFTGTSESTGESMNAGQAPGVTVEQGLQFVYGGRAFGFLGTPDRDDSNSGQEALPGSMVAWSAAGHGNVGYFVAPVPGGFVIVPQWASSSDMGDVRMILRFVASMVISCVLPAAGISAGTAIGTAVVGESFAAAYPALTAAIGNVALSTAMNGGNIEAAVKGAALSYAGAGAGGAVGGQVFDATGIQVLGQTAAAATAAFVQGRDVKTAVASTLAMNGASAMDEFLTVEDASADEVWTPPAYHDPLYDAPAPQAAPADSFNFQPVEFGAPSPTQYGSTDALFPSENMVTSSPLVTPSGDSGSATFNASDVIKSATSAMLSALTLVKAYNQARAPGVNTTARIVTASGAVVVANDNGYIQTRNPDGSVRSTKPPVGQPQSTLSGALIVNNGDGTYTRIDSMGNTQVLAYPATAPTNSFGASLSSLTANLSPTVMLAAGGGLLALLLFMRRR